MVIDRNLALLANVGRNNPCPCGSGRKFKHCCAGAAPTARPVPASAPARAAIAGAASARAAGDPAAALSALQRAAAAEPDSGELALALGQLLHAMGRAPEAMSWLDRAVARLPQSAPARLAQGEALEALGWPVGAVEAFRQACALAPQMAEPHARLGLVWMALDDRAAAAQAFRRAAALAPTRSVGRLSAAYAHLADGASAAAADALRRVISMEPRNAVAHAELGKLLAELGDAAGARAALQAALRLEPAAVGLYYDLIRIRRLSPQDRPLLSQMSAAARQAGRREIDQVLLELAIGRAHDDLDEPEAAMRHYLAAGQRAAAIRPLDRALLERRVDAQVRLFAHGPSVPDSVHEDKGHAIAPLLIVGLPRSGTTLVESILARHPSVGAAQELPYWRHAAPAALAAGAVPDAAALRQIADEYRATLRSFSDKPWVTDKKPDNFFWLGLILSALPQARIVHCRRHPLDVCVSVVANHFAPRPDFSAEAGDLVFYVRQYQRLMAHWRQVLPAERFLELDYEDLVQGPEPPIRRLLAFAGLAWDPACLHPEAGERRVSTASLWQVRQPISASSVHRWRRYAPWLGPLRDLLEPGD
jgi:Flp pilus assembly protein TadD